MPSTPELHRGDVVRVRLDPVEGSEQAGTRPVVILSPDLINEHSPVVIVASVTSRKVDRVYPFEVLLEPPEGGLTIPSKVLLMQLRSIAKTRIVGRYGAVTKETMEQVDRALKVATGLTPL